MSERLVAHSIGRAMVRGLMVASVVTSVGALVNGWWTVMDLAIPLLAVAIFVPWAMATTQLVRRRDRLEYLAFAAITMALLVAFALALQHHAWMTAGILTAALVALKIGGRRYARSAWVRVPRNGAAPTPP